MSNDEISLVEQMMFEKYFYGDESIPLDELYLYFQILRQTYDLMNSKHTLAITDPTRFEMVLMSLHKINRGVNFNGAVSNGIENRWIDGVITKKKNRYHVVTHVYRLSEQVPSDIKEYYVYDTFKEVEHGIAQETIYDEPLKYRQKHSENIIFQNFFGSFDMESFAKFKKEIGKNYTI